MSAIRMELAGRWALVNASALTSPDVLRACHEVVTRAGAWYQEGRHVTDLADAALVAQALRAAGFKVELDDALHEALRARVAFQAAMNLGASAAPRGYPGLPAWTGERPIWPTDAPEAEGLPNLAAGIEVLAAGRKMAAAQPRSVRAWVENGLFLLKGSAAVAARDRALLAAWEGLALTEAQVEFLARVMRKYAAHLGDCPNGAGAA